MTGGGAGPAASMIGSDVSLAPRDGWIEQRMGSQTLWFRNQQAIEQFGRAAGLQGMLDALANARQREATTLRDVQDLNRLESAAQDDLQRAIDRAQQRLDRHYDEIDAAEREHRRLKDEYVACLRRCEHAATEDQRIGVAGVGLMLAGMLVVAVVGNPFGGRAHAAGGGTAAPAAGGGGTPVAAAAVSGSTASATPVPVRVGPIGATFSQPLFTTFYRVPIAVPDGTPVRDRVVGRRLWDVGRERPARLLLDPSPPAVRPEHVARRPHDRRADRRRGGALRVPLPGRGERLR